jgi:hypothetical protein
VFENLTGTVNLFEMFSFNIVSRFFFEKIYHSVVNAHKQLFRTQGVGWGLLSKIIPWSTILQPLMIILACLAAHLTCSAAFVPLPLFSSRSESRRSANFAERSLAFPFPPSSRSHDLVVLMAATRPESYDIRGLVELDPKSTKVLNTDASSSGLAGAQPKITSPKFDDVCEFTGVTLSRFMSAVSRENPELRDLETLISGIQQSVKTIAKLVERGGNWGPEEHKQKQLVNVANDILRKTLAATGTVGTISAHSSQFSQQEEFPLMVSKRRPKTAKCDWAKL